MWSIIREQRKIVNVDISIGKQQRLITCMRIDQTDTFAYLGTTTGDLLKIVLGCCDPVNVTMPGQFGSLLGAYGVQNTRKPFGKDCTRYVCGIRVIYLVDTGLMLIGSGDGTIDLVEERKDVNESTFKKYPMPTWPMLKLVSI